MKKHYILLCGIFATFAAFGQFTPPDDATQAVTVDASTLEIVNPERESYINTNFMLLSPGTGISGTAFNGVTAQTWAINTDWLVQNYHQYLTRGTGLTGNNYNGQAGTTWAIDTTWLVANYHQFLFPKFGLKFETGTSYNGQVTRYMQIDTDWMDTNYAQPLTASTGLTLNTDTTYNGKAARTMTVDRAYIEQVIRETAFVVDNYQIYIDTTPSVNAIDATETQSADVFIAKNADLNMGASTSGGWANVAATKGCWQASTGGWSCYYVNNYDLTDDTQAASLGITYAVALANTDLSGVPITQQLYNNKIDLSPYAGRRIKIAYSFYAKKIYDGSTTLALATLGTVSTNLTHIKSWNSQLVLNSWVKLEDTIYYTVPARTDGAVQRIGFVATKAENGSVALANFSFQVFEEAEYSVPKNTEWTDGEFKILDADGNLIYWVSTQWGAQMGGEYESNPATDLNAKIFYTSPENENNGSGKGREWIEYVHNNTNARTIYEHAKLITGSANPTIGGIIIQPNLQGNTVGGTAIKSIFGTVQGNTPNNYSYVYLKCSPTNYERSPNSPHNAIWRPYNALSTAIQKSR